MTIDEGSGCKTVGQKTVGSGHHMSTHTQHAHRLIMLIENELLGVWAISNDYAIDHTTCHL